MSAATDEVLERLATDTVFYARNLAQIVPERRALGLIPLEPKPAQIELDRRLEQKRAEGKPQFAIVLKARRVGISTWAQCKLIQRATLTNHHNSLVVAHDVDTGGKLFGIAQRIYANLPGDSPELKPPIRSHKRARFMHFGQRGEAWMTEGGILPDSSFWVDTAGEFEAGRGGVYHSVHFSEYAFYPQPETKHTAIAQAIPRDPDSLWIIESTANGMGHFKELWDDAVEGRSDFVAFFWPWWLEPDYAMEFAAGEREEFRVGDVDQSPYAEDEPELRDPGPVNVLTGEHVPLTLEQLKWRRWAIANRTGGRLDKFHQEYPSSPEDAFLASGQKVFDPILLTRAMRDTEQTDPRTGQGGPLRGSVIATERPIVGGRTGKVERPAKPTFKPARELLPGETADWRVWLEEKDGKPLIPEDARYVVGVDVSGGVPESEDESGEPAYHAIEVIDHKTKEQIAEYRSRCDPDLLAEHALLTAEFFNEAWLAPEVTGGYGMPVARRIRHDWHYRFAYSRKAHDRRESEKPMDRLGWDTNRATKPILIAGGQELLREGTHGIKSRRLVSEMLTYIRLSTGATVPEKGKFADLLMAWLIAQQVAIEMPLRQLAGKKKRPPARRVDPVTGYTGLARAR